MESNHPFRHQQEVEAEGTGYKSWSLQINTEEATVINSEELVKIISGDGISFVFDEVNKKLTIKADVTPPKPNKPVDDPTYLIVAEDAKKWLVFNKDCIVTVPRGLAVHEIFEGEANTGVTVTFQAATDAVVRHVESISKILSGNAPFGIRVKATDDYTLYGTNPINYNG